MTSGVVNKRSRHERAERLYQRSHTFRKIFFIDGNTADERLLTKLGLRKAVVKNPLEATDDDED